MSIIINLKMLQIDKVTHSEKENKLAVYQLVNARLRHGIIHARASIDWCNECLEDLNKEK